MTLFPKKKKKQFFELSRENCPLEASFFSCFLTFLIFVIFSFFLHFSRLFFSCVSFHFICLFFAWRFFPFFVLLKVLYIRAGQR